MAIFLSILRGINLGGHKKILMADLKTLYEELGFTNVVTYIQSGNVVFENPQNINMEQAIGQKIFEKYAFEVPIIIRTLDELASLIDKNPFLKEENIQIDKLHVTFLADLPQAILLDKMQTLNYALDRFTVLEKEAYLYCPDGYGNTKLTNSFFESKLKVTATTRNWKTVNELFKMMKSR
jgi:uncharacterized protein (DUF1697 family)